MNNKKKKRKLLKRIALTIIGMLMLLILALTGVFLYWRSTYSYQTTKYNARIEQKISDRIHQKSSLESLLLKPEEGVSINGLKIRNKVGFSEKNALECRQILFPVTFQDALEFARKKAIDLKQAIIRDSKINLELSSENGVNFPNQVPPQLMMPVQIFEYKGIPVTFFCQDIQLENTKVMLWKGEKMLGSTTLPEMKIIQNASENNETGVSMSFVGSEIEIDGFHAQSYEGEMNLFVNQGSFGSGVFRVKNVEWEELPAWPFFQEYFELEGAGKQNFEQINVSYSVSDRQLLLSSFVAKNKDIEFQISGSMDVYGGVLLKFTLQKLDAQGLPTLEHYGVELKGTFKNLEYRQL